MLDVFAADARKHVGRLRDAMDPAKGGPDADEVRRAARRLHHSAVLADHWAVAHAAGVLQKVATQVIAGERAWSEDLTRAIAVILQELDTVLGAVLVGDAEAEVRLMDAADELVAGLGDWVSASGVDESAAASGMPAQGAEDEADRELGALISELEDAVDRLQNDPRDREPLKLMLRRIRRLRELGRIEVLSPPDRALSAVEELILQIADLNATVGPGYLTVFRHAREVLDEMRAVGASEPATSHVEDRAVDVDELKEKVMETARRARQVVWVSDLFFARGPHVVSCPIARERGETPEQYFRAEATQRLDRSEHLRKTMLVADTEQMRLAGESLAHTLRHLRERAVAFNHGAVGRVTRRAAAALRAQLVRPPSRLTAIAAGFGDVFSALRAYLATDDESERARAVADAEAALHLAILGGERDLPVEEAEFGPDAALQQALSLRTRVDERLNRLSGPDADGLREDLEALFDLIAYYVSVSAERD